MPPIERLKPLPRTDGAYLVSDEGEIFNASSGRRLTPYPVGAPDRLGRRYLGFRALGEPRQVHVAVCEAFHGPRPEGHHAAHGDGDKTRNRADNLAWKTPLQNAADKIVHGTQPHGVVHHNAKLTDDAVRDIRSTTGPQADMMRKYGVSQQLVSQIRNGKGWPHVSAT